MWSRAAASPGIEALEVGSTVLTRTVAARASRSTPRTRLRRMPCRHVQDPRGHGRVVTRPAGCLHHSRSGPAAPHSSPWPDAQAKAAELTHRVNLAVSRRSRARGHPLGGWHKNDQVHISTGNAPTEYQNQRYGDALPRERYLYAHGPGTGRRPMVDRSMTRSVRPTLPAKIAPKVKAVGACSEPSRLIRY